MAKKPDTRWSETGPRDASGVLLKSFKVHKDIWAKVEARATDDGVAASEIVRRALIAYVGLPPETPGVVGRADRQ